MLHSAFSASSATAMGDIVQDLSWVDTENDSFPAYNRLQYYELQHKLYRQSYGEKAIWSKDGEEFADNVRSNGYDMLNAKDMEFYEMAKSMGLETQQCKRILAFIHSCEPKSGNLSTSWSHIRNRAEKHFEFIETKSTTCNFPEAWRMETFNGPNRELKIHYLDILELIALNIMVNPEIMFRYGNHVVFEASRRFVQSETGESDQSQRVIGDLMSADWAIETQQWLREN